MSLTVELVPDEEFQSLKRSKSKLLRNNHRKINDKKKMKKKQPKSRGKFHSWRK